MAGDGVSLPTTLSQIGSVAKTQARGQQHAQQAQPFADQLEKKDELKPQRVKETEKAEKQKIDREKEKEGDRRRRRRQRRKEKSAAEETRRELDDLQGDDSGETGSDQVGRLLDLRA